MPLHWLSPLSVTCSTPRGRHERLIRKGTNFTEGRSEEQVDIYTEETSKMRSINSADNGSKQIRQKHKQRVNMHFLTNSQCTHRVKMKRWEWGCTAHFAGLRRSHLNSKQALYSLMGFDILQNTTAAAHQIWVNLVGEKRHYWFTEGK